MGPRSGDSGTTSSLGGAPAPAGGMTVPFNDLRRHWAPYQDRLEAAVTRVLRSGWFLLGPETEAFEAEFATFCGAGGCVAVGNGTDALELALRAVGCAAGDEVVVAPNAGMYATTAVLAVGGAPVFADVDPVSLVVTPESVAAVVSERTAAVVVTHLYGNVVDVGAIRRRVPPGVAIVEDCAQAHGARLGERPVGALGDAGAFSFYPTKNLGAVGDAGAVVANRSEVLERARSLRQYGWRTRYVVEETGGRNSRIDEVQAAVLRECLPRLGEWNDRRAEVRARYLDGFGDRLRFVRSTTPDAEPVTHLCVVRTEDRDRLRERLGATGVRAEVHYPVPDHRQPVLRGRAAGTGSLDESERACAEVLSLPCFPALTDDEVEHVVAAVVECT